MPVSSDYVAYVVEQLAQCANVRTRRMFGGVGIYHDDVFFALIDDDQLFFKVNDSTREEFVARGSNAFRPVGRDAKIVTLAYYTVPADVLEDVEELKLWVRRAIAVAQSAGAKKKPVAARARASRKKQ